MKGKLSALDSGEDRVFEGLGFFAHQKHVHMLMLMLKPKLTVKSYLLHSLKLNTECTFLTLEYFNFNFIC